MQTKAVLSLFYRTCQNLGDAAMPQHCVVCHTHFSRLGHSDDLSRFACTHCVPFLLACQQVRCLRCGLTLGARPQAFGWTHCRHCRPFQTAENDHPLGCVVCADYIAPFDQWITSLKYGNNHGLARFLGNWLAMNTQRSQFELPDVLIPVPSSTDKLRRRGYNQAALIARHAGRNLKRPVQYDWLIKIREAGSQAELGRDERLHNLEGAFVATRLIPPHVRVGLVDDVITTGATFQSCVNALRKAGAQSITTMAICRTPE